GTLFHGGLAEWPKAHDWKSCEGIPLRGFESRILRPLSGDNVGLSAQGSWRCHARAAGWLAVHVVVGRLACGPSSARMMATGLRGTRVGKLFVRGHVALRDGSVRPPHQLRFGL